VAASSSRKWLYLPFVALLLLALAWTGFWFYARHRVQAEMDLAIQREAERGRAWACPDRRVAGFPFRIELTCAAPRFTTQANGGEVSGSVVAVRGLAQAYDPNHVIFEMTGPLTATVAGRPALTMDWKLARASVRATSSRLERLSVEVDAPRLAVQPTSLVGPFESRADRLEWHVRPGPEGGDTERVDAALRLSRLVAPALQALLRSADPADAEIDLKLLRFAPIFRGDWREILENWRVAGGTASLEIARIAWGRTRVEVKGPVALDAERRLEGRLDMSLVNADQLLRQFGVGGATGALLGGLLGSSPDRDRTMRLPLVLQDGRASVGPIRVGRLEPLY
jgi:hypothetical protein